MNSNCIDFSTYQSLIKSQKPDSFNKNHLSINSSLLKDLFAWRQYFQSMFKVIDNKLCWLSHRLCSCKLMFINWLWLAISCVLSIEIEKYWLKILQLRQRVDRCYRKEFKNFIALFNYEKVEISGKSKISFYWTFLSKLQTSSFAFSFLYIEKVLFFSSWNIKKS